MTIQECWEFPLANWDGLCSAHWMPYSSWTITPSSSNSTAVFSSGDSGQLDSMRVNYSSIFGFGGGIGATPVVYLSANVRIVSGTGTEDDPYILSIG